MIGRLYRTAEAGHADIAGVKRVSENFVPNLPVDKFILPKTGSSGKIAWDRISLVERFKFKPYKFDLFSSGLTVNG